MAKQVLKYLVRHSLLNTEKGKKNHLAPEKERKKGKNKDQLRG
jgi:hypothetical protein